MTGVDIDQLYGLPIGKARRAFTGPDLWIPALVKALSPVSSSRSYGITAGWRDEVLVAPRRVAAEERWPDWDVQNSDPWIRAQKEKQATFYNVSLKLGRQLLDGTLQGFGQVNSLMGPWEAIPREAWHVLRVSDWRLGHLTGGGLDLWNVRVLDMAGLPLHAMVTIGRPNITAGGSLYSAALAYGPLEDVAIVHRAAAFGIMPPNLPAAELGSLAARMAELPEMFSGALPVREDLLEAAFQKLDETMLSKLRSGELIAVTPDGAIPKTKWTAPDLAGAIVNLGNEAFRRIKVHQNTKWFALEQTAAPAAIIPSSRRKDYSLAAIERAYLAAKKTLGRDMTKPESEIWAAENGCLLTTGRRLHTKHSSRGPGRPRKMQTGTAKNK